MMGHTEKPNDSTCRDVRNRWETETEFVKSYEDTPLKTSDARFNIVTNSRGKGFKRKSTSSKTEKIISFLYHPPK